MFLKSAKWITDKYIMVMLGLFPLFFGTVGYSAITRPKAIFFMVATGIWVVGVVLLLAVGMIRGEQYGVDVRPAHLAVSAFLAAGAISACLSEYGNVTLTGAGRYDGYITTVLYGLIFFGVSLLGKPKRRYAWTLGISCFLCCLVAMLQLGGLDPLGLYPAGTNYFDKYEAYNGAFLGTIGNVDILSAYLCLAAPFLIVFGILSKKRWDTFLILPGALAVGILLVCEVAAGQLALLGCALISVPIVIRSRRGSRIAAGCSAGLTGAGLAGVWFWPGSSGTIWEFSQVLHGNLADEFGSHRGQIWKRCWELFQERPFFGGGPGTSANRFNITWSRYIETLGRERRVYVDNAHSVYFGYLVDIGLVGLLSYLAIIICSLHTWWSRRREGALYPALGAALVCYLLQDMFGLGLCLTQPMLWVAWGLLETGRGIYPRRAADR